MEFFEVKIKEESFWYVWNNRAGMIYEGLTDAPFYAIKKQVDYFKFVYAGIKAGAILKGIDFNFTFDEFVDYCDKNEVDILTLLADKNDDIPVESTDKKK